MFTLFFKTRQNTNKKWLFAVHTHRLACDFLHSFIHVNINPYDVIYNNCNNQSGKGTYTNTRWVFVFYEDSPQRWFYSVQTLHLLALTIHLNLTLTESTQHFYTHTYHTNISLRGHWVQVKGVGSHHSQSLRVWHRSNTCPNAMLMCSWWQWFSCWEGIHSVPKASKHLHQNTDWPRGAVNHRYDIIMSPLYKNTPHLYTKHT